LGPFVLRGSEPLMPQTKSVITFSKREGGMPMPHLLDIQTAAFDTLLVPDDIHGARQDVSLERVFRDLFPITDVNEKYKLEFLGYALGEAKYAVEECIERDMTYAAPLKAKLRLDVYEEVEGQKRLKNAIEKEVYLGELPIMTPLGTFVINGAERVVVSQLHRSPGVVFEEDTHPNGQRLFSARIIPFRGSWVEFTIDIHDVIYVHIDKKKKFPATALLRAFGHGNNADILKLFFATKDLNITGKLEGRQEKREVIGALVAADVPNPEDPRGEPLAVVGDELSQERLNEMRHKGVKTVTVFAGYSTLDVREEEQPTTTRDRHNHVLAFDAADPETGEVLAEGGAELTDALRKKLIKAGVHKVEVLLPAGRSESPLIKNTLAKDPTHSEAEALEQIYALLRPGDAPNLETARQQLQKLFFNPKRYDLGRVGRYKINQRLKLKTDPNHTVLTEDDFVAIIRYLIDLHDGRGFTDDIDHLGNRRIRRPLADGAAGQGADEHQLGPREDLARRPGQRPDGERRHPGVLRELAALPVHGPDQSVGGADQQAAPVGAGSRRPHPRACRLRGARRPLLAVRPDVPDRDAGRPEYRSHHQPLHLRPDQRAGLHRDAVSGSEERQGDERNPLALGERRGGLRGRPGQCAAQRRRHLRGAAGALPEG
jgi:DNA-directed RNA polymerase subunit beta